MTENKYQFGKIYKLTSEHTNKIYVGSTCQELLNVRLKQHTYNYKRWKDKKGNYVTSYVLFELGLVQISLLEDYPCNTKEELISRERHWIELHLDILVNKNIPTRTNKEYYEDNKEKEKERHKKYIEANKERHIEYTKQYNEANKEKRKQWNEANKEKINEQRRKHYEANKDRIKEQKRQYYAAKKLNNKNI